MNHINSLVKATRAGLFVLAAALPFQASADTVPESGDPIVLAMNEWSSQQALTKIAGKVLTKMGYQVEYASAGYTVQMQGISTGDLSATLEIWEVNIGEGFPAMVESGAVEILGDNGMEGAGGWIYSGFAEEMCPGLPSYEALKDCPQVFADTTTFPKGRLIDMPAEWGNMHNDSRIEALGLDFQPVSGGSEGAMIAEMKSSFQSRQPVLVSFWWPHWIFAEVDMKILDVPEYEDGCYDDPSWGVNPERTYDCGEGSGRIMKVVWPGLQEKWPAAYRTLKAFSMTNEHAMKMMYALEVANEDLEDVTDAWIAENEPVWREWIEASGAN